MSEASKNARAAMRAKAKRLSSSASSGKVDASSWEPSSQPMNSTKKTGMRPVSPRTYKLGGRVQGDRGPKRSDKAPRGNPPEVDAKINRNVKEANGEKFGRPHIGGLKKGGKVSSSDADQDKAMIKKALRQHDEHMHGGKHEDIKLKKGGRTKKQGGGGMTARESEAMNRRINDTLEDSRNLKDDTYVYRAERRAPRELSPPYIRDSTDRSDPRALRDLERGDYDAMLGVNPKESGMKKGGRTKKQGGGMARASGGKAMKRFGDVKMTSPSEGSFDLGGLGYDKPKTTKTTGKRFVARPFNEIYDPKRDDKYRDEKKRGGSVAGGERPTGDRIPRARGGSTYADADDKPRLRLVKTHTDGNKTAKVYKDADWGEYRVKNYVDGAYRSKADYHTDDADDAHSTAKAFLRDGKESGGRVQRATGGRAKGKTNINIIVNPNKAGSDQPPMPGPIKPPAPPMPMPQMAPPPPPAGLGAGGPPPMPMGGNMPPPSMAGGPPMPRKRGGRAYMNAKGGSGGGLGRLEKAGLA